MNSSTTHRARGRVAALAMLQAVLLISAMLLVPSMTTLGAGKSNSQPTVLAIQPDTIQTQVGHSEQVSAWMCPAAVTLGSAANPSRLGCKRVEADWSVRGAADGAVGIETAGGSRVRIAASGPVASAVVVATAGGQTATASLTVASLTVKPAPKSSAGKAAQKQAQQAKKAAQKKSALEAKKAAQKKSALQATKAAQQKAALEARKAALQARKAAHQQAQQARKAAHQQAQQARKAAHQQAQQARKAAHQQAQQARKAAHQQALAAAKTARRADAAKQAGTQTETLLRQAAPAAATDPSLSVASTPDVVAANCDDPALWDDQAPYMDYTYQLCQGVEIVSLPGGDRFSFNDPKSWESLGFGTCDKPADGNDAGASYVLPDVEGRNYTLLILKPGDNQVLIPDGDPGTTTGPVPGTYRPPTQQGISHVIYCWNDGTDEFVPGLKGGHKYSDRDGDLETADDRTPLPNWQIELLNANAQVIASTTTDTNGYYQFSDLPAGDYTVQEVCPATGWLQLYPAPDSATEADCGTGVHDFTVTSGFRQTDNDFINKAVIPDEFVPGLKGGHKYSDRDGDLETADDRTPLPNWQIELLDANAQVIASTTTDTNGYYQFSDLPAGDYTVQEVCPATGWLQLYPAPDSATEADCGTGVHDFTVTSGFRQTDNDFINKAVIPDEFVPGLKGGHKYSDRDGDLETADDRTPLPNWQIELLDANAQVIASTTTDTNGYYQFSDLPAGDYTVQEVCPATGWLQLYPAPDSATEADCGTGVHDFTVTSGFRQTDNDFINKAVIAIELQKTVDPPSLPEGGTFTYTLVAQNRSPVPVIITDLTDSASDLSPDFAAACGQLVGTELAADDGVDGSGADQATCSYTVTYTEPGEYENQAAVTIEAPGTTGPGVTSPGAVTVRVTDVLPTFRVRKDAIIDPANPPFDGDPVTYRVSVSNLSPEALIITKMVDDKFGDLLDSGNPLVDTGSNSCLNAKNLSIARGSTATCVFTAKSVSAADTNAAGDHINTVTVEVRDNDGNRKSASDQAVVFIAQVGPFEGDGNSGGDGRKTVDFNPAQPDTALLIPGASVPTAGVAGALGGGLGLFLWTLLAAIVMVTGAAVLRVERIATERSTKRGPGSRSKR